MKSRALSFVRSYSKLITVQFAVLALVSFNAFSQTNLLNSKAAYGTLAEVTEKTEVSAVKRSRIVNEFNGIKSSVTPVELDDDGEPPVFKTAAISQSLIAMAIQLEQRAFDVINQRRVENGLERLVWSEETARIARLHSSNMARFKFFSHTGLDGKMVNDRADSMGLTKWRSIGENIAYNRGYDNPAEFAAERWMQSPSHRENILNKRWKEAAIGVAITPEGTYYFTEVFVAR